MARDCPEPRKEEGGKSVQAGEYYQIQLNLSEEDTYINMDGFDLLYIGFEEIIIEP